MCEKNFEGKQLSLFPNDEDDINEETIVDNDIDDDNLIIDDKDNIVVDSSKRKKRSKKKKKICKTCNQNITSLKKRDSLRYNNTYDQELAKNYCKEHESSHSDHKCKPHWCGDCGYLMNYGVEIEFDREDYYK